MNGRVAVLAVLGDVYAYLADLTDVVDGDYGQPAPNQEMTLAVELHEARHAVAELIEAARDVDGIADHAEFVSDECCCGSRMDAHDMGSGHAPVDSGTYYGGPALDRLRAALARVKGGTA